MSAGRQDLAGAASASQASVRSAGVSGALTQYRAGCGPYRAGPRAGHAFVPRGISCLLAGVAGPAWCEQCVVRGLSRMMGNYHVRF